MRVLHLYNVFGAPTERAWLNVALGVAAAGHQVACAYERLHEQAPPVELPTLQCPRITVEAAADVDAQMNALAAREPVVAGDFDVVHGHFGPRVLWGAPWIARCVRVVISLYGYDASRLLCDPAWAQRYRWAAERGATFVALSDAMAQRLIGLGLAPERVRVVRLGIDPRDWPLEPPAADAKRFVFVGRLTPKKAPEDAVRAAALVPDARLDIIGSGELEGALRERITGLGVADRVRMLGPMDSRGIRAVMRGCAALVLPSVVAPDGDEEGTPVVLMEAQAMGLACITTRHAGNAEVVSPAGRPLVVPERAVEELAAAMRRVMAMRIDERAVLGVAGRAWIERRHDLRTIVPEYLRLYAELAGSRR